MRCLLLNQFYLPDVAPTGRHLHELARAFVRRGHQVKVLCSRRSYNGSTTFPAHEYIEGVEVVRLPATGFGRMGSLGKMSDYLSFYGSLAMALLFERDHPDLVLSLTTPPYVGLLGKMAAKRHNCRHAHWIMDLYPDVMFAHGMARRNRVVQWGLRALTRLQLKGAQSVITLGPVMAESVSKYIDSGQRTSRLKWFALWSDPELEPWPENEPNALRVERGWLPQDVVFLYSGNMGLGHRFNEFLQAANRLGPSGPRWVFAGGGKRKAEVEMKAKSLPQARVQCFDYVPHSKLRAHLCSADVHLASLDSAWQGLMVPSKVQGSFAVGRPVLYVGGRDCETAVWIEQSGGGWVVDQDDVTGLLEAVQQACNPDERRRRGQAALDFARKHFNREATCTSMVELLEGPSVSRDPRSQEQAESVRYRSLSCSDSKRSHL